MNNNIDLKIINLEHRIDRRNECIEELAKFNLKINEAHFFKAKYVENLGALGCSLSHAMLLSEFLYNSNKPYILVLEDDFQLNENIHLFQVIDQAITHAKSWNVFLLGHNGALPIELAPMKTARKIINAQTTSGYLVNRLYAVKLISYFFRSAELLAKYKNLPSPNKEIAKSKFSCDILWKELQICDNFWATFPAIIKQRKSFSDIENKLVDYGV